MTGLKEAKQALEVATQARIEAETPFINAAKQLVVQAYGGANPGEGLVDKYKSTIVNKGRTEWEAAKRAIQKAETEMGSGTKGAFIAALTAKLSVDEKVAGIQAKYVGDSQPSYGGASGTTDSAPLSVDTAKLLHQSVKKFMETVERGERVAVLQKPYRALDGANTTLKRAKTLEGLAQDRVDKATLGAIHGFNQMLQEVMDNPKLQISINRSGADQEFWTNGGGVGGEPGAKEAIQELNRIIKHNVEQTGNGQFQLKEGADKKTIIEASEKAYNKIDAFVMGEQRKGCKASIFGGGKRKSAFRAVLDAYHDLRPTEQGAAAAEGGLRVPPGADLSPPPASQKELKPNGPGGSAE